MKTKLTTLLLVLTSVFAFGHGGIEVGPNGGRILELAKDESRHGEVTVKDGKFYIALLDGDKKPLKVDQQTITATGGTREKPEKLTVEKTATGFVVPAVAEGQWLIVQYKETSSAKPVTARMQYDTTTCSACKKPEWVCECDAKGEKK